LQRDPIGMAGGWNLYQYCGGEPWGYVDPSGLILDDFIDGMREVRDLFTGRAAEEDARWDAANSKAVGKCFKQAKKLEQEGKPECIARTHPLHPFGDMVYTFRQGYWTHQEVPHGLARGVDHVAETGICDLGVGGGRQRP